MNTSAQFNQWLEEEIDTLDYSGRQLDQFKVDAEKAIQQGLFTEFIDSIAFFPYPNH